MFVSLIEDLRSEGLDEGVAAGEVEIRLLTILFRCRVLLRVRMLFYIKHEIIGDYVQQIAEGVNVRYVEERWKGEKKHFKGIMKYFVNNISFAYFLLKLFISANDGCSNRMLSWFCLQMLIIPLIHSSLFIQLLIILLLHRCFSFYNNNNKDHFVHSPKLSSLMNCKYF